MKRVIVQPADLSGAALADLKQWLGITRQGEDAQLVSLLSTALDLCEGFIRQAPLEMGVEETWPLRGGWQAAMSSPVRAITKLEAVAGDGSRSLLDPASYEIDIDADAAGRVRVLDHSAGRAIVISLVTGIAPDWVSLPDALRHGLIRLAAHHYRDRDAARPLGPPASIAALWRPWQHLRVA